MASDCTHEDASNMSALIVGPFVTWFVTVRKVHRARVLLGEICGPEREEVTGDWRKLHSEELHGLCYSPNAISVMK
jgi:hypothetical protein